MKPSPLASLYDFRFCPPEADSGYWGMFLSRSRRAAGRPGPATQSVPVARDLELHVPAQRRAVEHARVQRHSSPCCSPCRLSRCGLRRPSEMGGSVDQRVLVGLSYAVTPTACGCSAPNRRRLRSRSSARASAPVRRRPEHRAGVLAVPKIDAVTANRRSLRRAASLLTDWP